MTGRILRPLVQIPMRRAALLLLLAASAHAQTPDEVATAAFTSVNTAPALAYRFAYTIQTPEETTTGEGTVTASIDTLAGRARFRIDQSDQSVAYDGRIYRVLMPRTRRIYADSSASELANGIAGLLMLHPTIGTSLLNIHNGAVVLTDDGEDTVDGAPCRRLTYSAAELDSTGSFVTVCYDAATRLPSQTRIVRATDEPGDTDGPLDIDVRFSDVRVVPAPAPPTFTFAGTEGYTEVPYTSDEPLLELGTTAPPIPGYELADDRGRPVLIDFWGTWCAPCAAAIPEIEALRAAYPDLVVLGLAAYEDDDADPEAFARQRGATYPVLRVREETLEAYRVSVFPTYYLIGSDGTVRFSAAHRDDGDDPLAAVRTAVGILLGPPR